MFTIRNNLKDTAMYHAKILGSGSYLPANRVTNDDLAQRIDTLC